MTVVAVITQAFGRYCLESLNPAFAHVWVCLLSLKAFCERKEGALTDLR